eukprot:scaffold55069_cov69-Phaeocystis_antarctica.AAC.4
MHGAVVRRGWEGRHVRQGAQAGRPPLTLAPRRLPLTPAKPPAAPLTTSTPAPLTTSTSRLPRCSRLPRHLGAHLPAQVVAPLLGGRHVLVGRQAQRAARGRTARRPWRQRVAVDVAQPLARLHDECVPPLGGGHLVRGERLAAAARGEGHRCGRVDLDRAARAVGEEGGALPLRLAPRVQRHRVALGPAGRRGALQP